METTEKLYDHTPQTVTSKDHITLLWDMPIQTDRTLSANKPDIVIKDTKTQKCTLIDVAVPSDGNIAIKGNEKKLK